MNAMKCSVLLLLLLFAGCNCAGSTTSQSATDTAAAPFASQAADRADAIIAAADAAPDSAALDAAIDDMFADDDREMAQFDQAEAEAATALRDSAQ